jgi:glutamate carboxypeptidase
VSGSPPPPGRELVEHFRGIVPRMLDDIEQLVQCESPSSDLAAVASSADKVAEVAGPFLGVDPECVVVDGWTHLLWRLGPGPAKVLLLGHHDTVWPSGSLVPHPFAVQDDVLRGPGCFDMKAGLVMALHALSVVTDITGITLLVTGDEELGSPSSRTLIETEAAGCEAVLVMEPSGAGGALKRERKGVSRYEVSVHGRAAHAGLEPEAGVNAAMEMAHQILAIGSLSAAGQGTTVTPTVAAAGDTVNTVPATATIAVDSRAWTEVEQSRVHEAMLALGPRLEGGRVAVTGGPNRPPIEAGASSVLFERARRQAAALGLGELGAIAVGGASDGNFTAGMGVATLDGLGAVGGGAHAAEEHVQVTELPNRTALLAALIADLTGSHVDIGPAR